MATPSDLKAYLQGREAIPMMALSQHFHKDPAVLRDMLSHWIRKGKVRLAKVEGSCRSGCGGCSAANQEEVYTWIDDPEPT